jgi:uncharacterized protein YecT (DUF1311 family)
MIFARHALVIMALILWSSPGWADWDAAGAAAQCLEGQSFTLVACDDSADEPLGFSRLAGRNDLSCKVANAHVRAIVQAYPPGGRGMGMGTGYVSIDSLRVDGVPIFGHPKAFNWSIPGSDRPLMKVSVFKKDDVPFVEACDTDICHQQSLASDVVLNLTYKNVMQGLRPTDQKQLRAEQRFWLKERDPQCQLATVSMSNEPLGFLRCVISATDIRTIRLGEWKRH